MHIIRLDIENFRCIKELAWHPRRGRNVIIGPANAGKSTILEALRLLLGVEHSWLREETFSRFDIHNLARTPGVVVRIGATLHLTEEEWQQFAELEEPYDRNVLAWGEGEALESPSGLDEPGLMLRVALFYEWDRPDPEDRVVAFFPKFGPPGSDDCRRVTRCHREALGFWFVPHGEALWDLASLSARSHLSRVLGRAEWDPLSPSAVPKFVTDVVERAEQLEEETWPEVTRLAADIAERIREILPAAARETSLRVTAALSDVWARRMLELASAGPEDEAPRIPLSREGTGMQRAFMIAAQSAYATVREGADGRAGRHVVGIDEPEVGLHPQRQRSLLRALGVPRQGSAPQLLTATHSLAVLRASDPGDAWVIRNDAGSVRPIGLDSQPKGSKREHVRKNAERYWDWVAPGLFGRRAIVVEGPTEEGALPVFDAWAARCGRFEGYRGFNAHDIAVVNADGIGSIEPIARVLSAFGVAVVALHDHEEDSERRAGIQREAQLVLHLPDEENARDFDSAIALGTSPAALHRVLQEWCRLYEPSDKSFAVWVYEGLPSDLKQDVHHLLCTSDPDKAVVDRVVELCEQEDKQAAVRCWFARRCAGKGSPERAIFGKTRRYARKWAEACVEEESVPAAVLDLFVHLANFVQSGPPPEGSHVFELRVCDRDDEAANAVEQEAD